MQVESGWAETLDVLFAFIFLSSLRRSQRKWRTILYSLLAGMVLAILGTLLKRWSESGILQVSLVAAMVVSLIHSVYTARNPPDNSTSLPKVE